MTDDQEPLTQPTTIGPYKVMDVLGEGGMGVVYLAEQTAPVRRRVALKVLKPGMDSRQVVARFESERQALAVMDHANIAKVLDSGVTSDGRPFFVMELVHGMPITHYADTHRLTVEQRLRLFLDVCAAVQHAHHKGVIHRDLKPSNVLVAIQEANPIVKVIDFGIAKAVGLGLTDRTLVTQVGQILGTPEYMSPEQAEMSGLDVDTRTDVYSLGVMLYELMVGVLPYDLAAKPDYVITHALRERDVPRPSTRLTELSATLPTVARSRNTNPDALRRELKGDLDWIILKAMEKDRTRRYDTPRGLATDIERHLAHEPVHARPPTIRYRTSKFVRRHRRGVLAAAITIVAILSGTAAATLGFVRARAEQQRAQQSADTAEEVTAFLVDLFRVANPRDAPGTTLLVRDVLDAGAERIRTDLSTQPVVRARLMRTMGYVYFNLGLLGEAAPLLEQAVSVLEAERDPDPDELARSLEQLGIVYRRMGRTHEAIDMLQRAVALNRTLPGHETVAFARTIASLSNAYAQLGRYGEAKPLLDEALAVQERNLGPDDPAVGITVSNLGSLLLRMRQPEEAEPYIRRALRITEQQNGPDHIWVGEDLLILGAAYSLMNRHGEAEAAYSRALGILTRVLEPDHPTIASALHNLAEVQYQRGQYPEARARFERALEIKEKALGSSHPDVANTVRWLANVDQAEGRFVESEAAYERAIRIYERAMDHPDAAVRETYLDYARLLRATGRPDDAAEAEARAARIQP
jgi:eukaryotic-like serine/threonine-protein kinase